MMISQVSSNVITTITSNTITYKHIASLKSRKFPHYINLVIKWLSNRNSNYAPEQLRKLPPLNAVQYDIYQKGSALKRYYVKKFYANSPQTPVFSTMSFMLCSDVMSPLCMTGTPTLSFIILTASVLTGSHLCCFVRPCTEINDALALSTCLQNSTVFLQVDKNSHSAQ